MCYGGWLLRSIVYTTLTVDLKVFECEGFFKVPRGFRVKGSEFGLAKPSVEVQY